tara:strand:- start:1397 stop:2092 length:696 start_codon:yes stop_codon:yes gene_type:complete
MTVYGYARVSTLSQADNTSIADQERQVAGLAMIENLKIKKILKDVGVSGSTNFFERPSIKDIDLKSGDVIIVAKLDRFTRHLRNCLNDIEKLKSLGVRVITKDLGDLTDDKNIVAQLMINIMASFADYERLTINARISKGKKAKAAMSLPNIKSKGYTGGPIPFGWELKGNGKESFLIESKHKNEARTLIQKRRVKNISFRKIAEEITEQFFPCSASTLVRYCGNESKWMS